MRKVSKVFFLLLSMLSLLPIPALSVYAADSDIVLSEIMMNAANDNSGEWVEICNIGSSAENIEGWTITDNNGTDTISTSMCPSSNCSILAGECWLITNSKTDLTNEFGSASYDDGSGGGTCPGNAPSVDSSKTIYLESSIGNGLANTNDYLQLGNGTDPVDCYSWDGSTTCKDLTYVPGGDGVDANFHGSDAQPVSNVAGTWGDADGCGSAYNMTNAHDGGNPTAITLRSLTATSPQSPWLPPTLLVSVGIILEGITLWRRRRKN